MKHIKKIFVVFFCLLIIGFVSGCGNATEIEAFKNLSSKEFFELAQNSQVLILDVRTPGEFTAGHIKNSLLIPVQVLNTDYKKITADKNDPILIYCRSGNRSVAASNILFSKGFKNLYNLKKGIKDWIKKGFPIEKQP